MDWLENLIRTYLERDIPQMGFRVPAARLRRLLGISSYDALLSNPVLGKSWEGFVVENILSIVPNSCGRRSRPSSQDAVI